MGTVFQNHSFVDYSIFIWLDLVFDSALADAETALKAGSDAAKAWVAEGQANLDLQVVEGVHATQHPLRVQDILALHLL